MRILLANQVPFQGSDSGRQMEALALSLLSAGRQVRCLVVDAEPRSDDVAPTRRIICRKGDAAADLPFSFPDFETHVLGGMTFSELSDSQMTAYRDALRRALDTEVAAFNPHLIHVQDIGILGHLALETGAPYVLSTSGREFASCRQDPRFRRYAEEAAENAGRIIAADETLCGEVNDLFGELDGRVVAAPPDQAATGPASVEWLIDLYRKVVRERFGEVGEGS